MTDIGNFLKIFATNWRAKSTLIRNGKESDYGHREISTKGKEGK